MIVSQKRITINVLGLLLILIILIIFCKYLIYPTNSTDRQFENKYVLYPNKARGSCAKKNNIIDDSIS